jgi:ectoine hydroxylase-related dioxygenase (phytanoyl-CoA dioxygenase family)
MRALVRGAVGEFRSSYERREDVVSEEWLDQLGATENLLSREQRQNLEIDGFVVVASLLDSARVADLRNQLDTLIEVEGSNAGMEVHREPGTDRLANLVNKGDVFQLCWSHPLQLAAVRTILADSDFKLSSLNSRAVQPGEGNQRLHVDWWNVEAPSGEYWVCNTIWMIDAFTKDNGATRVVPGSHRFGFLPEDVMPDPMSSHPDEVLVVGDPGSIIIFNPHLWHSGTVNASRSLRRAMHCCFTRRESPQQTDQRAYLTAETASRLTMPLQRLLDVT